MSELHILPAIADEQIKEIAILADQIWPQHFTPIIGADQVDYMVEKFQSYDAITHQIKKEGYQYFLFRDHGENIGYMGVRPERSSLFLSKLYLRKDSRGNGFASKAIAFLSDFCKEEHLYKIWLTVNKHNDTTIAIYQKLGFVIAREQKTNIGNGFYMDDYIMEKCIEW